LTTWDVFDAPGDTVTPAGGLVVIGAAAAAAGMTIFLSKRSINKLFLIFSQASFEQRRSGSVLKS
jgi:hypothetical protein